MPSPYHGEELPPLEFTELPQVTELHGAFAWAQWNHAVSTVNRVLCRCLSALTHPHPIETDWSDTVQLYPEDLIRERDARRGLSTFAFANKEQTAS